MAVPILSLATLALASASSSIPYDSTSKIPTLSVAILGPPFVNPPRIPVEDTQTPCSTESLSALAIETDTVATVETWISTGTSTSTSTWTLDPMEATSMVEATSSVSTSYMGFGGPTATFSGGECDQTAACANGVQARALRPTPVIDSGSMPLRGRLGWIWWAGWGVFPMSTCVLAML